MLNSMHGGRIYDKDIDLDFSVNINPLGMPIAVKQSIVDNIDHFETYPDTDCTRLRGALSQWEGVPFENIVCGNGADDIIFRLAKVLHPRKVLLLSPTFSEYERSLEGLGCSIGYYPLDSLQGFAIQESILEYLSSVDVFYLCNPNNPTGALLEPSTMELIVSKCIQEGITLIVDECFLDFVIGGVSFKSYLNSGLNLVIIKAFTKTYSMAGIRLGYAMCSSVALCNALANCGQSWGVSSVAQVCGISALSCLDYVSKTQTYIHTEREYLVENFKALGFKVYPSVANYILVQSPLDLYNLLLPKKILIRDCSNYRGLGKGYYRFAVKSHKDNLTLIQTLERLV